MESVKATEILDFPPGIQQKIRKMYGFDQTSALDEAIDILEDWVKKQNHFTETSFPRGYLERTILSCKGSVEKAKLRIDKMCTLRTLMPLFFEKYDVKNQLTDVTKFGQVAILPKLSKSFHRVFIIKCEDVPDSFDYMDIYRYTICIAEYIKKYDYCDGFVAVLDYTEVNLVRMLQQINLLDLRQLVQILTDGFGMRLKGIHMISTSKVVETFITILKQVLSAKLGDRIVLHKNKESLCDYVPREILPEEYDGKASSMRQLNYNLIETMSTKQHLEYMKMINKYKTNEAFRSSDKFNDQYLGVAGTFRTLHLD